jgi:hypothetical protein
MLINETYLMILRKSLNNITDFWKVAGRSLAFF